MIIRRRIKIKKKYDLTLLFIFMLILTLILAVLFYFSYFNEACEPGDEECIVNEAIAKDKNVETKPHYNPKELKMTKIR